MKRKGGGESRQSQKKVYVWLIDADKKDANVNTQP